LASQSRPDQGAWAAPHDLVAEPGPVTVEAGDGDGAEPQVPMAPPASRQLPPGLGPEDQLAAFRCGSRAGVAIATAGRRGHRPRRSGRGPVARACSASKASARPGSASAPTCVPGPASAAQPTTSSSHSGSASWPRTVCGPALGRPPALAPGAQLAASDRKLQRRRHLDEGIGLPLAHHRPPGEPQPRPGQIRQGPAGPRQSAPAPGGTPRSSRPPPS
jgi:hypothetical protein